MITKIKSIPSRRTFLYITMKAYTNIIELYNLINGKKLKTLPFIELDIESLKTSLILSINEII